VFGRRPRLAHSHQGDHPLRRQAAISIVVAMLLAIIALLLLPPHAHGNFVYWANSSPETTIGRAKINGTGLNNNFITGLNNPAGVAVDSRFIYWVEKGANRIGRANLDGTGVNPSFISSAVVDPQGIAVTANSGLFWVNNVGTPTADTIGHANSDGSNPIGNFATITNACGIAASESFVYWLANSDLRIGRVPVSGGATEPNFITVPSGSGCGVAVDNSFLYWSASTSTVGRVPVGGGTADPNFITNTDTSLLFSPSPAVNSQYIFWAVGNPSPGSGAIGRANIDGSSPNPALVSGLGFPFLPAAAPSNKITITSITRNKKKGTAAINAKVPGPGQVTLSQTSSGQDVNATAAAIKQVGLTITQASSFKLPVKPTGKTAKKLKKQVAKKGKGKVKVTVFITFVPAGVAGVPNSDPVKVKLVRKGKKRK
jgi:Low-density lipoprotein receptor repeat class B